MTDQPKTPRYTLPYPPRGMRRTEAASYIGVSPSLFDRMIDDGVMPQPKRYRGRVMWDRLALEEAFAGLPEKEGGPTASLWDQLSRDPAPNPWDKVTNEGYVPPEPRKRRAALERRPSWDDLNPDPEKPLKKRGRPKKT